MKNIWKFWKWMNCKFPNSQQLGGGCWNLYWNIIDSCHVFQRRWVTPISKLEDCQHHAHPLLYCLLLLLSPDCKQPSIWPAHTSRVNYGLFVTEENLSILSGQRRVMKKVKDIFLMKVKTPAPAQLSSSPLLDRLLVFSLKVWVYTRGLRFFWNL